MKFNNRPNRSVITADGDEIWLARDIAVGIAVLLVWRNEPYILVNQRGPGVPNFQGYWNLPCGYLDYDETVQEAAVREVWEECGVNILPLLECATHSYFEQPWDVHSLPGGTKQNVTIHHGLVAEVSALPEVSNINNEPNETTDICWLPLYKAQTLEFAFDHKPRIGRFVRHVKATAGLDFTDHVKTL